MIFVFYCYYLFFSCVYCIVSVTNNGAINTGRCDVCNLWGTDPLLISTSVCSESILKKLQKLSFAINSSIFAYSCRCLVSNLLTSGQKDNPNIFMIVLLIINREWFVIRPSVSAAGRRLYQLIARSYILDDKPSRTVQVLVTSAWTSLKRIYLVLLKFRKQRTYLNHVVRLLQPYSQSHWGYVGGVFFFECVLRCPNTTDAI